MASSKKSSPGKGAGKPAKPPDLMGGMHVTEPGVPRRGGKRGR